MPAKKITPGESMAQSFPKLNQAIQDAYDALYNSTSANQNSNAALVNAKKAVDNANSVRTEFNAVVARETDSDAMSRQAAINAKGEDKGNLKARLDEDYGQVTAKINDGNEKITAVNESIQSMQDPLAFVNSVDILCKFSARGEGTVTWLQGISINEEKGEIYTANQETRGTYLNIERRRLDGTFIDMKTLPIEAEAYTENLPYFYNSSNQLCFIVRTTFSSTYAIFNYATGNLSNPIQINGNRAKGDVDNGYFVTCDTTSSAPYTLNNIYIYDWESVKAGTPVLLNTLRVQNLGSQLVEKVQGLVVNNGYIFFLQGNKNGTPALTIYNTAGQFVNTYMINKESLAEAINNFYPNSVSGASYEYENESGCKYKGRLAVAQIVNGVVYVFVHNAPTGYPLKTDMPIHRYDTGYVNVDTYLNGAVLYGSDTRPQIRRIGNIVEFSGAIKGMTEFGLEVLEFDKEFSPRRNIQFTSVTSGGYQCNWQVQPNGRIRLMNTRHPSPDAGSWYPFSFMWTI